MKQAKREKIHALELLARKGLNGKEIAAQIGVSATSISDWSRKYGIPVADGRKPPKRELTQRVLKSLFDYSPATGQFKRRKEGGKEITGWLKADGYIGVHALGKEYLAHRLAWFYVHGQWPEHQIDHINGDRSDNRIANLRDIPQRLNLHNRNDRPKSSTGLRGVSYDSRRGKYRARIMSHGSEVWLGYYDCPDRAHKAYLAAKKQIHEGYVS